MKELLEFVQSIKWHVSVVIVIWLGLRAWVAVVKMRLEYSRFNEEYPEEDIEPKFEPESVPQNEPDPRPALKRGSRGTRTARSSGGRLGN